MKTYQMINERIYKMKSVEYMLYGLIIIALLMYSFSNNTLNNMKNRTNNNKNSYIRSMVQTSSAAYFMSAIALIFLIIFSITLCTNDTDSALKRMVLYPLPVLITILSFIFSGSQTLVFQNKLIENKVAIDYYNWNNIFTILSIIQTFLIFYYLIGDCQKPSSYIKYFIYIIAIFNIICLGIIQIILVFYSTDG